MPPVEAIEVAAKEAAKLAEETPIRGWAEKAADWLVGKVDAPVPTLAEMGKPEPNLPRHYLLEDEIHPKTPYPSDSAARTLGRANFADIDARPLSGGFEGVDLSHANAADINFADIARPLAGGFEGVDLSHANAVDINFADIARRLSGGFEGADLSHANYSNVNFSDSARRLSGGFEGLNAAHMSSLWGKPPARLLGLLQDGLKPGSVPLGPGNFTELGRAFAETNTGARESIFVRELLGPADISAAYDEAGSAIRIKQPAETRVEIPLGVDAGFNLEHGYKHPIALFPTDSGRGQISIANDVHGRDFLHVSSPMPPNLHVTVDGVDATSFLNRTANMRGHLAGQLSDRFKLAVGPDTKIEISSHRDGDPEWTRRVRRDPKVEADANQILELLRRVLY